MKKSILTGLFTVGLATGVFAQGQVYFDNLPNTSTSPTATANGQFFVNPTGINPVLENSATLYGTLLESATGTAGSYAVMSGGAGVTSTDVLLDQFAKGIYQDDNGYAYTTAGVATGNTAYFELQVWEGTATSLAAARLAGNAGADVFFTSAVGGGLAVPPSLTGMPAVILTVPEPGTFALAGLGAAALLIFRRRK